MVAWIIGFCGTVVGILVVASLILVAVIFHGVLWIDEDEVLAGVCDPIMPGREKA